VGACVDDSKRLIGEFMRSADFREGVAAQRDKRPPQFVALASQATGEQAS
jgi:hypothetical protein